MTIGGMLTPLEPLAKTHKVIAVELRMQTLRIGLNRKANSP
jgi:hypothetical protein